MSDLISRRALIERLEHEIKLTERYIRQDEQRNFSSDYISLNAQLNTRLSIKKIVEDMPTAYDLDKVVAILQYWQDYFKHEHELYNETVALARSVILARAIEIVRNGGAGHE